MLKMGATSLTESWEAKRTASHNHFMLGHITEWFYKDLAGIGCDPAGPGFKKIVIKPTPVGDLEWVQASYNSPHGRIISHWQRKGDTFTLNVAVPANTTATVHVPARSADSVTIGDDSNGVSSLGMEGDGPVFTVGSGEYQFRSEL
jgi:hypothetical protein